MRNREFINCEVNISIQRKRKLDPYIEITFDHMLVFRTVSEIVSSFTRMLKFSRSQTSNLAGFLDDEEFMEVVEETAHREKEIDVELLAHKIEILYSVINKKEIDYIDIRDIFSTSEEKVIKAEALIYHHTKTQHERRTTERQLPCHSMKDVLLAKEGPFPFGKYKVFNATWGENEG